MNRKVYSFLSNIFNSMTVNASRIIITFVLTLVLPKFLGEADYSYWQLYLFYFTYLAYTSLGWCEGTYLKYGGDEYHSLPARKMAGQFWTLAVYELVVNLIFSIVVFLLVQDSIKVQILVLAAISAILDILRYYLQMVLQATNQIKGYARIATCERILFFAFSLLFLGLHKFEFVYFIYAELLARFLSLLLALVSCKGIVFVRPESFRDILSESKELISSGYKLLLAGVAGQLIVGAVRFAIEHKWGNLVFGKVSLALSMVNMIITFITAVSVVIFPMLKRMSEDKLMKVYKLIREVITTILLCVLLMYIPMKVVLEIWLPQYVVSFKYLALLLPICIYETRFTVLLSTYFKALRKEKIQLKSNLTSMIISLCATILVVYGIQSLDLAIVLIVVLMAFKSHYAEFLLRRYLDEVDVISDNVWESILVVGFMVAGWFCTGLLSVIIYAVLLGAYFIIRRNKIKMCVINVKALIR